MISEGEGHIQSKRGETNQSRHKQLALALLVSPQINGYAQS